MKIDINSCTEITSAQYMTLNSPEFIAQTRMNTSGEYWMIFKNESVLYKIKHTL